MSNVVKLIVCGIATVIGLAFAFLPEFLMYLLWHAVSPESTVQRLLLVCVFAVAGTGACVFFPIMALGLWASFCSAVVD